MPMLHVSLTNGTELPLPFSKGQNVREILAAAGIFVNSSCGGEGDCGLCAVRAAGRKNEPTEKEKAKLDNASLSVGLRLSCQVKPDSEAYIQLLRHSGSAKWRKISPDDYYSHGAIPGASDSGGSAGIRLGVAVDIGTTTIRLSLRDISSNKRLAGVTGLNPQILYGSDVLKRISAAAASAETAGLLRSLTHRAITGALEKAQRIAGLKNTNVERITVVGNTAMMSLFAGKNFEQLLEPERWNSEIDYSLSAGEAIKLPSSIAENTVVDVARSVGGFIGSDLFAGIIATRITESGQPALYIDFGTNSEIALWDGSTMWATSAAGGPAFEGCGILSGMPAEPGAIYKVEADEKSGGFAVSVLGGSKPEGICGSGLVDLIAVLVKKGELDKKGRFVKAEHMKGMYILPEWSDIKFVGKDVDAFQRAKAAIGAGVASLMSMAGLKAPDIGRILVCGAFGKYLNIANAMELGVIPTVSRENVELCGATALAGCEYLLSMKGNAEAERRADEIRNKFKVVNMAEHEGFESEYFKNLYLQPMREL